MGASQKFKHYRAYHLQAEYELGSENVKEFDIRRKAILIAITLFSMLVYAQSPVKLELVSFKVITYQAEKGKLVEKLIPVTKVAPGDILEWRLRAKNTSTKKIKGVALIIPIPSQTYYLNDSASPLKVERNGDVVVIQPEFSFDGGRTYSRPPLFKKVKKVVDGKEIVKEVPVSPEEYTHARWVLEEMLPGETVEVFLRTVVR